MPIEVDEDQRLDYIIGQLSRLRLCRERFNLEINQREEALLQQLSDARGLGLEHASYGPQARNTLSSTDSETEEQSIIDTIIEEATRPSSIRFLPSPPPPVFVAIESPRGVRVGDRIRITNRLNHISGTPSETDRLGTVIKVNRIRIGVRTDSGHVTSRIKANLQICIPEDE